MRTETATLALLFPLHDTVSSSLSPVDTSFSTSNSAGNSSPASFDSTSNRTMIEEAASPSVSGSGVCPNVGFIGAGALASTLAIALSAAGWKVDAVTSRSHTSARRLARLIPGCNAESGPQDVVDRCRITFLTVPDDAISQVASSINWPAGRGVVHCCGVGTSALLIPAENQGALCGSFHPLQTFTPLPVDENSATLASLTRERLKGITFAVEGTGWLQQALQSMASSLGGRTIEVSPEHRALYHVSAVMSCGSLVALLRSAAALWQAMGVDQKTAFQSLLPLARTTLENAATLGPEAATTGPVTRGDADTVRTHLQALQSLAPEVLPLYAELTRVLIAHASTLDGQKRSELARLLAEFSEADSLWMKKLSASGSNHNDGGQSHA